MAEAAYKKWYFTEGDRCYQGMNRKAIVRASCGVNDELIDVTETDICVYEIRGGGVWNLRNLDDIILGWPLINIAMYIIICIIQSLYSVFNNDDFINTSNDIYDKETYKQQILLLHDVSNMGGSNKRQ